MAVANPVAMAPVQMAVADQAAMAVVMPMAVAAMHLNQQVAFGVAASGMADCGATGAAETGVNKAAIPMTVAAKVIFVSMVFTLLGLSCPAS